MIAGRWQWCAFAVPRAYNRFVFIDQQLHRVYVIPCPCIAASRGFVRCCNSLSRAEPYRLSCICWLVWSHVATLAVETVQYSRFVPCRTIVVLWWDRSLWAFESNISFLQKYLPCTMYIAADCRLNILFAGDTRTAVVFVVIRDEILCTLTTPFIHAPSVCVCVRCVRLCLCVATTYVACWSLIFRYIVMRQWRCSITCKSVESIRLSFHLRALWCLVARRLGSPSRRQWPCCRRAVTDWLLTCGRCARRPTVLCMHSQSSLCDRQQDEVVHSGWVTGQRPSFVCCVAPTSILLHGHTHTDRVLASVSQYIALLCCVFRCSHIVADDTLLHLATGTRAATDVLQRRATAIVQCWVSERVRMAGGSVNAHPPAWTGYKRSVTIDGSAFEELEYQFYSRQRKLTIHRRHATDDAGMRRRRHHRTLEKIRSSSIKNLKVMMMKTESRFVNAYCLL